MDQALVASIRKNLEATTTEELRRAYERGENAAKSPEEAEAVRQLLDERRTNGNRTTLALASAILIGMAATAGAWWQGAPEGFVLFAGVGGAIMGFASFYIPGLFDQT
ncbi:MAG: hypothetical protein EXS16_14020 [Gemmataceae bacterium]|nr:hypothetical protein [Gemmataceae bacterium]